MRTRRVRLAAALTLPLILTSTACSGDDDTTKKKDSSRSPASSARASQSAPARALAERLRASIAKIRTAHFAIVADIGTQQLTGSGDEKLSDGTLSALRANATLPGAGAVGIIVLGDKRYAKLPPPLTDKAKPWLPITADSDNAVVKQVAGVLDAALAAASLDGLSDVADAFTSARRTGTRLGRTSYTVTVDPARLPAGPARSAVGSKTIPANLDVDSAGRPVSIGVRVTLLGQPTDTTVTFTQFDDPVTITAPPAGQIAAG